MFVKDPVVRVFPSLGPTEYECVQALRPALKFTTNLSLYSHRKEIWNCTTMQALLQQFVIFPAPLPPPMAMASWVPPLIAARPLFLHLRILTTQHPPFKHTTQSQHSTTQHPSNTQHNTTQHSCNTVQKSHYCASAKKRRNPMDFPSAHFPPPPSSHCDKLRKLNHCC